MELDSETLASIELRHREERALLEHKIKTHQDFIKKLQADVGVLSNLKAHLTHQIYDMASALEVKDNTVRELQERIEKFKQANSKLKKQVRQLGEENEKLTLNIKALASSEGHLKVSTGGGGKDSEQDRRNETELVNPHRISDFTERAQDATRRTRESRQGEIEQTEEQRDARGGTHRSSVAPRSTTLPDGEPNRHSYTMMRAGSIVGSLNELGEGATPLNSLLTQMQNSASLKLKVATNQISLLIEACSPMTKLVKNTLTNPTPTISDKTKKKFDFAIDEVVEENSVLNQPATHSTSKRHLFEEILVLGVSKQKIREVCAQTEGLSEMTKLEPAIIFRQGFEESEAGSLPENHLTNQIANFVFPFGFFIKHIQLTGTEDQVNSLNSESMSPEKLKKRMSSPKEKEKELTIEQLIQEYIMKDQVVQSCGSKCFYCFNSEETLEGAQKPACDLIEVANPHKYRTYYCVIVEELICLVGFL